jgi:hypothetical protein
MSEHFERFKEGWIKGDPEMVLSACADDYVYDDPLYGRFTKADFGAYLESLPKDALAAFEFTEMVSEEIGGLEKTWFWYSFKAPAGAALVSQEGAALFKVGRDGVHSTKVTYYAHEPYIVPGKTSVETSARTVG